MDLIGYAGVLIIRSWLCFGNLRTEEYREGSRGGFKSPSVFLDYLFLVKVFEDVLVLAFFYKDYFSESVRVQKNLDQFP